jgi:hypothetical protein
MGTRAVHNCEIAKTYQAVLDRSRTPASYWKEMMTVAKLDRRTKDE